MWPSLVRYGLRLGATVRGYTAGPSGGSNIAPLACSTSMKEAIVSNMLTSTSWPSPVRSRWNSAIIVAYSAVSPATLSAMMVPT